MTGTTNYVEIARRVIQERAVKGETTMPMQPKYKRPESLESVLQGKAIELWSTAAGRLFLVASEEDARQAMERFGALRGEIYTAAEVRRIIGVNDPSVVAEIHDWKRRFDGAVRDVEGNLK
jgi:hypothetical protein